MPNYVFLVHIHDRKRSICNSQINSGIYMLLKALAAMRANLRRKWR